MDDFRAVGVPPSVPPFVFRFFRFLFLIHFRDEGKRVGPRAERKKTDYRAALG